MKKELTTLILLFLLIFPLVIAEDNITKQTKEKLSALKGGLDNRTEDILEREVPLPPIFKVPLNLIFGIEDGSTWQQLIIVLGIWIGFFILILSITDFMPFINKGFIKILTSIIITILVSITGSLNIIAMFFFDVAGWFKWTASWGPLRTIVAILIAGLVIFAFNFVSHKIKKKIKIEKAEEMGEKAKEGFESAKIFSEGVKEFSYSHKMRRGGTNKRRGRFVSKKSTERYSKMFGDEQANKRFKK